MSPPQTAAQGLCSLQSSVGQRGCHSCQTTARDRQPTSASGVLQLGKTRKIWKWMVAMVAQQCECPMSQPLLPAPFLHLLLLLLVQGLRRGEDPIFGHFICLDSRSSDIMSMVTPAGYVMKNTDLILLDALTSLRASPFLAHIYKDSTAACRGISQTVWPTIPAAGEGTF